MDPGLEEGPRGGRVGVIGRHDRHRVDAVLQAALPPGHLGEVGIDPVRLQEQILSREPRPLGIRGERTGDELPAVVEPRRDAVHRSDEGALPAADHAEPKTPFELSIL